MRWTFSQRASKPPPSRAPLRCNLEDVFGWGVSPPETNGISGAKSSGSKATSLMYNSGQRRCTLCDERLEASFQAHSAYVGHIARVGIIERAVALLQKGRHKVGSVGRPPTIDAGRDLAALVKMWWARINVTHSSALPDYRRIPALSAPTASQRLWRVRFLIQFLRDRDVIRDSLRIARCQGAGESGFVRSPRFERSEMIGDNIVKVVIPDRLVRLFPASEGGVTHKLACIQQMLDSNEGLLQIYDYLDLNSIVGIRLPNNKTKSDVVESLFGELQSYLWTTEVSCGCSKYPAIPTCEHRYVRALVDHLLNELTHMIIMWRIESTLKNGQSLVEQLQQKGVQSSGHGAEENTGSTVFIKESEWDRGRYAVLPLLLPFPYRRASYSPASVTGRRPHRPLSPVPMDLGAMWHLKEGGTPLMLFDSPVPLPEAMRLHYTARYHVVSRIDEYWREVFAALTTSDNVSVLAIPSISTDTQVSGSERQVGMQPRKRLNVDCCLPWERAAEKFPTWHHDVKLSQVRHAVAKHIQARGLFVDSVDWRGMLDKLSADIKPDYSLKLNALHCTPMRPPGASARIAASPAGVDFVLGGRPYMPPLQHCWH
ncbi:hypothetical protein ERJ75_000965700 [Trypanosoma vivax]|nr:hypothetical protein ERJ75_000965700 [Trypanosoma vivax]